MAAASTAAASTLRARRAVAMSLSMDERTVQRVVRTPERRIEREADKCRALDEEHRAWHNLLAKNASAVDT